MWLKKRILVAVWKSRGKFIRRLFIFYARDPGMWPGAGPGGIETKTPDFFCVIPKAETETKIQVQIIHLRGEPRKCKWEKRGSKTGKEKKSKSLQQTMGPLRTECLSIVHLNTWTLGRSSTESESPFTIYWGFVLSWGCSFPCTCGL